MMIWTVLSACMWIHASSVSQNGKSSWNKFRGSYCLFNKYFVEWMKLKARWNSQSVSLSSWVPCPSISPSVRVMWRLKNAANPIPGRCEQRLETWSLRRAETSGRLGREWPYRSQIARFELGLRRVRIGYQRAVCWLWTPEERLSALRQIRQITR